jgi:hypothetical protein
MATPPGDSRLAKTVYLQRYYSKSHKWKTYAKRTTGSTGVAGVSFKVKHRWSRYYRWYASPTGTHLSASSGRQKVKVK